MIYFKNKTIKIHREPWGAVVRTPGGELVITKEQLKAFDGFETCILAGDEDLPTEFRALFENQCILAISEDVAEKSEPGILNRLNKTN